MPEGFAMMQQMFMQSTMQNPYQGARFSSIYGSFPHHYGGLYNNWPKGQNSNDQRNENSAAHPFTDQLNE